MSVFELAANVPKLKRVGLVKVINITDEAIHALVERASTLERLHLSYCNNLTVPAITYLLNKLPRLTHLSLTGVSSFRTSELQAFCRPAPKEFNEHQAQAFCVFSGNGISDLRRFLNSSSNTSDDGLTRRDSASSGESVTATSRYTNAPTRGRLPSLLDPSVSAAMGPAFASHGPNFLAPAHAPALTRRLQARDADRHRASVSRNEQPSTGTPSFGPSFRATHHSLEQQPRRSRQGVPEVGPGPPDLWYSARQRVETANNSSNAVRRNSEEPEILDGRWMGAPVAYMGRMLRMAGIRRQREGVSPGSEGEQGEASTRRAAWGPE